jgi:hypothetical protein
VYDHSSYVISTRGDASTVLLNSGMAEWPVEFCASRCSLVGNL